MKYIKHLGINFIIVADNYISNGSYEDFISLLSQFSMTWNGFLSCVVRRAS